jgi:AcrR family transcriptional regulator
LRDIAAKAEVNLSLIRQYVGDPEELVAAVFDYLAGQVTRAVVENPLAAPPSSAVHGPRSSAS